MTILLNNSKSLLLHPNITQHNITDIYDEYFQVHKANLSSKNQTFRDLFEMDVYERLLNVNYMRSIFKLHGPIVLNGKVFKSLDISSANCVGIIWVLTVLLYVSTDA